MAGKKVKLNFWKSDWFVGLLVSGLVFALGSGSLLQSFERKAYDLGVELTSREPSDRIAVIAIDEQSLDNIGGWPWSREIFAEMIEKLAVAKAKVIATTVLFAESQRDPGAVYIDKLVELNNARLKVEAAAVAERAAAESQLAAAQVAALQKQAATKLGAGRTVAPVAQPVPVLPIQVELPFSAPDPIAKVLAEAEQKLNPDRRLAMAIGQAGNVVLPMHFHVGQPSGRPARMLPEYMGKNAVKLAHSGEFEPVLTDSVQAGVVASLGKHATAIGYLNVFPDADGVIRAETLALDHFGQAFPSLSLLVAALSLNLEPADIQVRGGGSVRIGKLKVATDNSARMLTHFYRDEEQRRAFPVDSFSDVRNGNISVDKYRDKIVLIGVTAAGVSGLFATPVAPAMASVQVLAHAVSSILSGHHLFAPAWGSLVETGVFLLVALYLILLLPRLSIGMGIVVTALLLAILIGTHFGLMMSQSMWLQLMVPTTLLLMGHLLLATKRILAANCGGEKAETDPAESNRLLALAFLGQGQLDMAFSKFRNCVLNDELMENLYNLGLEFERKHQFDKAEAVFRLMADHDIDFRDLAQRIVRARQMSETVILGGAAGGLASAKPPVIDEGALEKALLGRYQIERELGKGAMGVVYQGRDSKINRMVAIKTMALSQEFEADELVEVKERFFREAETAGRLNHPNIVTVFDAGEERDLAYIAMEFLKGRDLVPETKPGSLLPLPRVVNIVACVAEALDYAHANNVVHRDIKPANIMYEPESGQVKVTDFGIARITDSSKTKTGMVLGTPSYMSPEQLAGKRVDGRSDLYSLGVMLFQLCAGQLPFVGESMAQLMFRIAGEPHPDIRELVPGMPECLAAVIDKSLVKDPEQRYQTGGALAHDLRACLAELEGGAQ